MTWIADASLWTALVLTALLAGTLASRWRDARRGVSPRIEALLLASAAACVVSWCANAGELAGDFSSNELLAAHVPIAAAAGFRLAVLWATLPGGALTLAMILLIWSALSSSGGSQRDDTRVRFIGATSAIVVVALGVSTWFAPAAGSNPTVIPPFVQSPAAAIAPLFALLAVAGLAVIGANAIAGTASASKPVLLATWGAATAAVVCEQIARSQLGLGPRDPIALGSASAGLILWLAASALLHQRVQALLSIRHQASGIGHQIRATVPGEAAPSAATLTRRVRYAARAGHVGALCLAVSFAAHAFAARSTVSLPPGASISLTDAFQRPWQLASQGVSRFDADGVDILALAVETRDPGGRTRLLTPEIRDHHGRDGQHLANAISLRKSTGTAMQAMRVLLLEADSLDVASVRVTFLPVPVLWQIGLVLLVLSAVLALSSTPRPVVDQVPSVE